MKIEGYNEYEQNTKKTKQQKEQFKIRQSPVRGIKS